MSWLSPRKKVVATKLDPGWDVPKSCVVTGGSGFVGQRLVEMLVERGAERVVSFDISPTPKGASTRKEIVYFQGDLTDPAVVEKALEGSECVYHIAALVGPYHAAQAYIKVNYEGTVNVVEACKRLGIKRIVMSSSPSTRFPYPNPEVDGLTEEQLFDVPTCYMPHCTPTSATNPPPNNTNTNTDTDTDTTATGEWRRLRTAVLATLCRDQGVGREVLPRCVWHEGRRLAHHRRGAAPGAKLTHCLQVIALPSPAKPSLIALLATTNPLLPSTTPTHVQVYGPRDGLFLPSLLMVAGSGKLRIFGAGENSISFCHGNQSQPLFPYLVTLANTKPPRVDR
jgi:hypothetical protein